MNKLSICKSVTNQIHTNQFSRAFIFVSYNMMSYLTYNLPFYKKFLPKKVRMYFEVAQPALNGAGI